MQKLEISKKRRINKFLKTVEKQPEKANSLLKPQVVIHRPEEKELPLFKEVEKPKTTEQKEELPGSEMLYEVERVEVEEVKFLEVEPKEIIKKEGKITTFKKIEGGKIFGEPDVEEELSEWEPIEPTVSESEIPKKEEEKIVLSDSGTKIGKRNWEGWPLLGQALLFFLCGLETVNKALKYRGRLLPLETPFLQLPYHSFPVASRPEVAATGWAKTDFRSALIKDILGHVLSCICPFRLL